MSIWAHICFGILVLIAAAFLVFLILGALASFGVAITAWSVVCVLVGVALFGLVVFGAVRG